MAKGLCNYSDDMRVGRCLVLKETLNGKPSALIVDETTDDVARSVLNIIVIILSFWICTLTLSLEVSHCL